MGGFTTTRQGIDPLLQGSGDIGPPSPFNPASDVFVGPPSPYSSSTQPLMIDIDYAQANKDRISGTQAPCSFSGRGAPVCGSPADIAGSAAKAERTARANAPFILLGLGVVGFLLWRFS